MFHFNLGFWTANYCLSKSNLFNMHNVTVSSKFQIVIPKEIRKKLNLRSGDKLQILGYDNRIELFIVREVKKSRGFLKGMNTDIEREDRDFADLSGVKFIKK